MNTALQIEIPEKVVDIPRFRGEDPLVYIDHDLLEPNEETLAALIELESGGGNVYENAEELFRELEMSEPNEETLASFAEAREGNLRSYTSVDALLADIYS